MAAADVGVIIPAWNAERTIGAALASVAGQTQLPGSVTVIDDGSSDGTVATARAFQGTLPLEVIELGSNDGVAHARDIGIRSLRTPHVALLDSDDLWLPDHLEITAPLLRTGVIVSANGILWRPGRRIEPRTYQEIRPVPAAPEQRRSILRRDFVFIGCLFTVEDYRRTTGFRPGRNGAETWDLWIRMLVAGVRVEASPAPTYIYRVTSGSLSASEGAHEAVVRVLLDAHEDLLDPDDLKVIRRSLREFRARRALLASYTASQNGDGSLARRQAIRALAGPPPVLLRALGMIGAPRSVVRKRDERRG